MFIIFIRIKSKPKKQGFTLIELVAVIAIIAVLAAAFTPKIAGYIDEAKKVAVLDQAKRVITAYEVANIKSSSLSESSTITNVATASNGLLSKDEITKIPEGFTVEQCRNLLNTEKYGFSIEAGIATEPILIQK